MDVGISGQLKLPDAKHDESEDKGYKKKNSCCFRAVGCRFKNVGETRTFCLHVMGGKNLLNLDKYTGDCSYSKQRRMLRKSRTFCWKGESITNKGSTNTEGTVNPLQSNGGKSKIQEHEAGSVKQHLNLLMDEVMKLNQKAISANLPPDISRTLSQMEAEASKVELRITAFQKDHQINEICKELQEFCKLLEETKQCVTIVEAKLTALDDRLTALPREINKCSKIYSTLNRQIEFNNQQFTDVEDKLMNCQSRLHQTEQVIEKTEAKMMTLETMTQTGIFIWKIPQIKKRLQEAIDGTTPYLDSSEFYFYKYGYKMCLRIYLDGCEEAQGTHISLYYILLKGQYDALTQWPFKQNVKLALLNLNDRQQSILKIYVPNEQDPALQRPVESMNAPRGFPMFATSSEFNQRFSEFVMGDEMFVGAEVIPGN